MAGSLMRNGGIDAVIVAVTELPNGDGQTKIGTYPASGSRQIP